MLLIWLSLTALISVVTWLAIWSRYPTRARWLTVVAFLFVSPASGFVMLHALGKPLPVIQHVTKFPEGEVTVLGAKIIQDVAIYLLIDAPEKPVFYALPWNVKQGSKLQESLYEGNGTAMVRQTFPGEFVFYPPPHEESPEKEPIPDGITY